MTQQPRSFASRLIATLTALSILLPSASLFTPAPAHARTQGTRWVTKQLLWNGTTKQKTFTASLDDTAWVQLPNDIDWSAYDASATINSQIFVYFVVKGAAVASADTVHFLPSRGAGGYYAYVGQIRDVTVAAINSATLYSTSPGGMIFVGNVQTNPTSTTRTLATPSPTQSMRLKVHGDPDGALNSLECWVSYAATPVASNPTRWVTVPLKWNNGSYSRTFAAAQTDSAFLTLPSDIDWSCIDVTTTTNQTLYVDFVRTGTAVSGADSVHFLYQPGFGGTYSFRDYRDETPSVNNGAYWVGAAGPVMTGALTVSAASRGIPLACPSAQSRLKVQGDPNGILNGVQAFLTYPQQR